jgi:hypothetical protein
MSNTGIRTFAQRHGIKFGKKYYRRNLVCQEPLRTVLQRLELNGWTTLALAKKLGRSNPLIVAWRKGTRDPSLFDFKCLCEIAKVNIKVEIPDEEPCSVPRTEGR